LSRHAFKHQHLKEVTEREILVDILFYYALCGVRNTELPGFGLKNSCSLSLFLGAATQLFLFTVLTHYLFLYL